MIRPPRESEKKKAQRKLTKSPPRRLRRRLAEAWQCDRNSGSTSRLVGFALLCEAGVRRAQTRRTTTVDRRRTSRLVESFPHGLQPRLELGILLVHLLVRVEQERFEVLDPLVPRNELAFSERHVALQGRVLVDELWGRTQHRISSSQSQENTENRRRRCDGEGVHVDAGALTCFCTTVSWSRLRVKKSILRCCVLLFEFLARLW